MFALEITLFVISYTALAVSLAFGILCYKRNIESKETLALTVSLLLLVIAISVSPLLDMKGYSSISNVLIISSMTIVGATTFLNTLKERKHKLPTKYKHIHIGLSTITFMAVILMHFLNMGRFAQWLAVGFLMLSVLVSMIMIRTTEPQIQKSQKIKPDRLIALAFIVVVPVYLVLQFGFSHSTAGIQIGFLLPMIFTLLAVSKISDDMNRLSILKGGEQVIPNNFPDYGLTSREIDVAQLLTQGCTYQFISDKLYISIPTVKTHTGNIYRKCNVKSKFELIKLITN